MKNKILLRTGRLCRLGVRLRLMAEGQREEVCNHKLSKAERAFAACSSGRKNKKGENTSAFVSTQVHFIART